MKRSFIFQILLLIFCGAVNFSAFANDKTLIVDTRDYDNESGCASTAKLCGVKIIKEVLNLSLIESKNIYDSNNNGLLTINLNAYTFEQANLHLFSHN